MTNCPLTTEALLTFLVARLRVDLKQKPDAALPDDQARDNALASVAVLLHDHINQLKTRLSAAQAEAARRLATLNNAELGDNVRRVLARHRGLS